MKVGEGRRATRRAGFGSVPLPWLRASRRVVIVCTGVANSRVH